MSTHLSLPTIAAKGIDPWRLDLFDSNPVKRIAIAHGLPRLLSFSPICDLSFQFWQGKIHWLARKTDSDCVYVKQGEGEKTEVQNDLEGFRRLFRAYLDAKSLVKNDEDFKRSHPRPASAFILKGSQFEIDECQPRVDTVRIWSGASQYFGNMLDEMRLPIKLPEPVNWLIDTLREWNPIISGDCVAASLSGEPVEKIFAYVDGVNSFRAALDRLTSLGIDHRPLFEIKPMENVGLGCNFRLFDCSYQVSAYKDEEERRAEVNLLFSEGLTISKRDEVYGNRIQFYDRSRSGTK